MTNCGACYQNLVFCRKCKTTHCGCTWNQCKRPTRKVVHALRTFKKWGGIVTTSLCGRVRTMNDGMNLADSPEEVTCLFCKKLVGGKG